MTLHIKQREGNIDLYHHSKWTLFATGCFLPLILMSVFENEYQIKFFLFPKFFYHICLYFTLPMNSNENFSESILWAFTYTLSIFTENCHYQKKYGFVPYSTPPPPTHTHTHKSPFQITILYTCK